MGWATRQARLRSLVGTGKKAFGAAENLFTPPQTMCFQVVVCYMPPESHDPDKFDALCDKHGIKVDDVRTVKPLNLNYEQLSLPGGFVRIKDDGTKVSYEPLSEVIYTSTDRKIINEILKEKNALEKNAFFDSILYFYAPEIKRVFQGIKFEGIYTDIGEDSAIMFQFIIHPYRDELCAPEDIGVLKPITIIDGHVIRPSKNKLDGFDPIKPTL